MQNLESDGFDRTAVTYAEILGEVGLAAFREHLELQRKPTDGRRSGYTRDVDELMVGWAQAIGDPDMLIEVYGPNRIYAGDVLEIARALTAAGREDEAVEWARRGLRDNQGPHHRTAELREYLAGVLRGRGDENAAVRLYWDAFTTDPSLTAYRRLLEEVGIESKVDGGWSQRCIAELRARLAEQKAGRTVPGHGLVTRASTALLDILLYEGRLDEGLGRGNRIRMRAADMADDGPGSREDPSSRRHRRLRAGGPSADRP